MFGGGGSFLKLRDFFFFLFQILVKQCHMQNYFTSKILYSDPDIGVCFPIRGVVGMQACMLANRWNSNFSSNFSVKGMLQASGSVGSWCREEEWINVCVYVCVTVCVTGEKGKVNLSTDMYHLLCLTVSCFCLECHVSVTGSSCYYSKCVSQMVSFTKLSCRECMCVCMRTGNNGHYSLYFLPKEQLAKCAILMLLFFSSSDLSHFVFNLL